MTRHGKTFAILLAFYLIGVAVGWFARPEPACPPPLEGRSQPYP